ncbi:MAG: peptide deformylase [Bdellovibrionales bacterium]|nr:peptide deformylase [Bdellovibrionales bacterium]
MPILEIKTYPDPILKKKSLDVKSVTPEYQKLAEDMLETMYAAPGIGLAAIQVGVPIRMLVIDIRRTNEDGSFADDDFTEKEKTVQFPIVIFNPVITKKEGKTTYEEGCLSVPGYTETVERAEYIEVEGLDKNGQRFEVKTDGLLAICFQHEMDHLEGKLFIDRISFVKSNRIRSKIKKYGYPDQSEDEGHSAL